MENAQSPRKILHNISSTIILIVATYAIYAIITIIFRPIEGLLKLLDYFFVIQKGTDLYIDIVFITSMFIICVIYLSLKKIFIKKDPPK